MPKCHHYAFDAAALVDECIGKLQQTIDLAKSQKHYFLFDLKESLVTTECLLHTYFLQLLEFENCTADASLPTSLSSAVTTLREALKAKSRIRNGVNGDTKQRKTPKVKRSRHRRQETPFPMDLSESKPKQQLFPNQLTVDNDGIAASWVQAEQSLAESSKDVHCYYPSRSATDTLLFRLIVLLQLCLVRIDDARFVITGRRHSHKTIEGNSTTNIVLATAGVLGVGVTLLVRNKKAVSNSQLLRTVAKLSGKVGILVLGVAWGRTSWNRHWMANKINDSAACLEEWQQQWLLVQSTSDSMSSPELNGSGDKCLSLLDAKSKRLIEYALKEQPRVRGLVLACCISGSLT
jgi:hypothetical protein